jgi:DNA-binding response OmpR family regulator
MAHRILLVEDEFIIAQMLTDALADAGYEVVGPFFRVAPAEQAAAEVEIDAAILDVNVAGQLAYPVADRLADRGIPYAFLSGYDNRALAPERHKPAATVRKPFEPEKVGRIVGGLLDGTG